MYRNWKLKELLALGIFLMITGVWRALPYIAIGSLSMFVLYILSAVAA